METDGESQATAEIMAAADTHSTSVNGSAAEHTSPSMPSPVIMIGAALVGGFVLTLLVRRARG
jgi:hypothetical protein